MQVSMGTVILDLLASILVGAGVLGLSSPLVLYWWIHGDHERYKWIIQGPYPYSHFGGGLFQLAMGAGLLLISGTLVAIGIGLKWRILRRIDAEIVA